MRRRMTAKKMRSRKTVKLNGKCGPLPMWRSVRLKDCFSYGKGLNITKADLVEDGTPVISYGQIHAKKNDGTHLKGELLRYVPDEVARENPGARLKAGDIVFADTSEDLDGIGNCVINDIGDGVYAGYHTLIARAKDPRNSKYLSYLFQTDCWREQLRKRACGIKVFSLTQRLLSNVKVVLPPRPEQERIAAFLDEKCATVDKAIEVKRKQLKNVGEFWANVLQELTVRGVCKSRLVQTGNVFIPEIPEGWKLAKTLHCLDMPITDGPHTTPELWDEGVPFVSAEAVSNGNGKIDFARIRGFISEEFYEECCKKYIPRRDDVYMVKSGATTGRVAIVDTDTRFTIWSPLAVFRAREYCILPRYLFYTIQAQYYQEQVERNWTFGTQQNIGMRALERLKIILPPLVTQEEIVNVLDERRTHLDDVASNLRKQIETLEQYRKSLIHEYVTGARRVV